MPGKDNRRLSRFLDLVRGIIVCGIVPQTLAAETRTESPLPSRDAGDFADWYRHALLERPHLVPELTQALAEVMEGLQSIDLPRVGNEARVLTTRFAYGDQPFNLEFGELSHGQQALLVLYALIHLTRGRR